MQPPDQAQLILGDGGAKRGHRGLEPRHGKRDHVHIAFGNDQRLALRGGLARGAVVVKAAALVEQFGFRRVEVFRVVVRVHRPAAKGDTTPARVTDREHDPVAEHVIGLLALGRGARKARAQDQVLGDALLAQMVPKPLPAVGRKADLEPVQRSLGQLAARKIVARGGPCPGLEAEPEMPRGFLHDGGKFAPPVGLLRLMRVAGGHRHPGLARKIFHRLHERHVFNLLQEGNRVALRMAAEAVVIALAVVDVEGRRLFLMEGAWRPEVALGRVRLALIPCHLAADDAGQRHAGAKFVKETGGQTHRASIVGCRVDNKVEARRVRGPDRGPGGADRRRRWRRR